MAKPLADKEAVLSCISGRANGIDGKVKEAGLVNPSFKKVLQTLTTMFRHKVKKLL